MNLMINKEKIVLFKNINKRKKIKKYYITRQYKHKKSKIRMIKPTNHLLLTWKKYKISRKIKNLNFFLRLKKQK
jgi:hypothetical protein